MAHVFLLDQVALAVCTSCAQHTAARAGVEHILVPWVPMSTYSRSQEHMAANNERRLRKATLARQTADHVRLLRLRFVEMLDELQTCCFSYGRKAS